MRYSITAVAAIAAISLLAGVATADDDHEHDHFDIAPYLLGGQLLTGGLDHDGNHTPPPVTVYGWEFEDPFDPFNRDDPGINQAAGVGNLPEGAALSYNILSNLLYWDGSGEVAFGSPGDAYITLLMGSQARTLDDASGPQAGSYIQAVDSDGVVHKHFNTSLYASPGAGNVPGISDPTYVEPPTGIYAFSLELVLSDAGTVYTSAPIWAVFNNGADEHAHHEAVEHLVPEPAGLTLLALGGLALRRRRKRI